MNGNVAAVDLGATSGRVMLGHVGPNELQLRQVGRFANGPVDVDGHLHWDITALYGSVLDGLGAAIREENELASIGVDSWAVDYALLRSGVRQGDPFHYRDARNAPAAEQVLARIPAAELYRRNGLQFLPFNTLFQLAAEGELDDDVSMLLIPDLFAFWLTHREVAERTNASTTGLLCVTDREWDDELIARLGYPRGMFPELVDAGAVIGEVEPRVAFEIGAFGPIQVTAVGSHDTASAVVAVPATTPDFAYISCGTWGLVGVELDAPVLTEASRLANFTNEGGVDGRVRYLRNVMGLWLLTECVREWDADLSELLAQAAAVGDAVPFLDPDDPRFASPGDMPAKVASWFADHGLAAPSSRAAIVRSILASLADAYARTVRQASELSGRRVDVVHLVGGGSQNTLLCQLTADALGLPVLAGPVEATAIGNVLVQARALGYVSGDLEALRALVASTFPPRRYEPRPG
ncbi:MAG: rhamnulokinase [Schumannella sp.]|nr:rhamnulokinase [Schumannella sp.]